jgi:hypothetical protein
MAGRHGPRQRLALRHSGCRQARAAPASSTNRRRLRRRRRYGEIRRLQPRQLDVLGRERRVKLLWQAFMGMRHRSRDPFGPSCGRDGLATGEGSGTPGRRLNLFWVPVARRPARFLCGSSAGGRFDPARRRLLWDALEQPHCARLVVAGRRASLGTVRRAFRPAHRPCLEADARAMDHRVQVAGPPPLRLRDPVCTTAPSVEGSGGI